MNTVTLSQPSIRGDVWTQAVNLTMTAQDFSGLIASASLLNKNGTVGTVAPDVTINSTAIGSASLTVTIPAIVTNDLPLGQYTVRVRITLPNWGPYTIVAIVFTLVA